MVWIRPQRNQRHELRQRHGTEQRLHAGGRAGCGHRPRSRPQRGGRAREASRIQS